MVLRCRHPAINSPPRPCNPFASAARRRAGPEPLLTLAGYRRSRGRITLGLLMNRLPPERAAPAGRRGTAAGHRDARAAGAEADGVAWLAVGARVVARA